MAAGEQMEATTTSRQATSTTAAERSSDDGRSQSWLWTFRRTTYVLRTEGPRSVTRKSLGRTVYGRVAILDLPLEEIARDQASAVSLDVQRLQPQHFEAYLRARPDLASGELERRLDRGDWCYVTWTEGEVSSSIWFRFGSAWLPELSAWIDLTPTQVFCYDNWTAPHLRGRNISATREASTSAMLSDAGLGSLVAHAYATHAAALRPLIKLGFKYVAVLTSVRLGWFRLDYIKWNNRSTELKLGRNRRTEIKLAGPQR
jgi:hypothetical protein